MQTGLKIEPGQLVLSCAGRDKGRFMLIFDILDSQYVYVVDGDLRKIENPKKKKLKHLKIFNKKSGDIAEKLKKHEKVYNDEIKKELEKMVYDIQY
jgi:large subunit ribosomal protein L14e